MTATETKVVDLSRQFRDPSFRFPAYVRLKTEDIGPDDRRLTVTTWAKTDRNCHSTRRIQIHDAVSGAGLFDTDDCYDSGNAIHKADNWLSEFARAYYAAKELAGSGA